MLVIFVITPILYLFSAMFMLKSQYQLDGFLSESFMIEGGPIVMNKFLEDGHRYTKTECFMYNFFTWTLGFLIGL